MIQVPIGSLSTNTPATIAAAATKSGVINTTGMSLCGIKFPAAFTSTTITFEMCDTAIGTFVPVVKADGSAVSYTVAQGKYSAIDPKDFGGIQFLKIVCGSTEGTQRALLLSLKGI